jgi:uncharacterized membrane protein
VAAEPEPARGHWLRWLVRRLRESVRDNVWLLPALGALIGFLMAMVIGTGGGPEDDPWTVTVQGSRDILFGSLGLVFTALSIVLALASVAAQNVVGRFGSRVLRIYARRSSDRWVIAMFTLAAVFILTEQFQLRRLDPAAPAPIAGLAVSVVLLVMTGAAIIWYIASLIRWMRTDRSTAGVAKAVRETARAIARRRRHTVAAVVPPRPDGAVDLPAHESGHLAEVDAHAVFAALQRIDGIAVVEGPIGAPVVRGQTIGWVKARSTTATLHPSQAVADTVDISGTRELGQSLEYGIIALVDIAIIALSPAINDPNSAVEVIEEMSFVFQDLAEIPLGPFALPDADSWPRVVVVGRTFGEFVDLATEQIVLYGIDDPNVRLALRRFADSLAPLDLDESDRAHVDAFAARLAAAPRTDEG